ncbi:MAG: S-adenosylmethionine:tRNA ribosyltransferase-isomerase [Bacteroidota bacterium]
MLVNEIRIENYTYDLPDERIARFPLTNRDQSKLLVFKNNELSETSFQNIGELLPENSFLFWNNTRVIQARLLFRKETGGVIEVLLLEPSDPREYATMFSCKGTCTWQVIIGNKKKWKSGFLTAVAQTQHGDVTLTAACIDPEDPDPHVRFSWKPENLTFAEISDLFGQTPIPPYLKRSPVEEDKSRYQTIYARHDGSVAAPTAGLHFSPTVVAKLKQKGIHIRTVTLHVGAGTFIPVKSITIEGHSMHAENVSINKSEIEDLLITDPDLLTAVGTTTLRSLESLYWIGQKICNNGLRLHQPLTVEQWDPYCQTETIGYKNSLQSVLNYLDKNRIDRIEFSTRLIIVPGYDFHVVNRLITNFHQPSSTLLLLIAAFVGDRWKDIYRYALDNGFRFLSYGDSSLLEREKKIND